MSMLKPVPNGTRDRCEEYIARNALTCSLFTLHGECETAGSIVGTMEDLGFHMDSFPRLEDAVDALHGYADAEVRANMGRFAEAGYDHVYAYVEEGIYEDGALADVRPGYADCIDYWPREDGA